MLAPKSFLFGICSAIVASPLAFAAELAELDLDSAIPTVLTPVRLQQPRTEVPASVTVIDRQLIEASGITKLPEIFRLVPGTSVGARSGWNYVVSYHGTTYRDSRRMQVMIDGRSIYQAGLATIDWNDIPLAVEDIERIEIVRGPDTAAYGANAFLGVINIITRHPDDSPRLRLKASRGSGSTEAYYGSTSGTLGDSSYRVTANGRRDSGFDENRYGANRRDSSNLQLFTTRWALTPLDNWNLDLQAGYKTGQVTSDFSEGELSGNDPFVREWYASAVSQHYLTSHNSVKWQIDGAGQHRDSQWRACAAIPILLCGDINEDGTNQRTDFDLQDTLIGDNPWKLVSGVHAQYQRANSETFYNGTVQRSTYQLFANFEYRFLPQWSATVAGSQEYAETIGQNFSPRVALLFFPTENHTLRAVYSEAIRTPDLFETKADWQYTATNVTPALFGSTLKVPPRAVAPGDLREENIRSREVGYYGLWLNRTLQVDLKWFWDDLTDLSSGALTIDSFDPANIGSVKQQGFETEIDYRVNSYLRLRSTYALIHSHSPENYIFSYRDTTFTPEHAATATAIIDWPAGWQFATNYYFANELNNRKYSRIDTRLQKSIPISGGELRVAGTLLHDLSGQGDLFADNLYNSPNRLLFSLDLIF